MNKIESITDILRSSDFSDDFALRFYRKLDGIVSENDPNERNMFRAKSKHPYDFELFGAYCLLALATKYPINQEFGYERRRSFFMEAQRQYFLMCEEAIRTGSKDIKQKVHDHKDLMIDLCDRYRGDGLAIYVAASGVNHEDKVDNVTIMFV